MQRVQSSEFLSTEKSDLCQSQEQGISDSPINHMPRYFYPGPTAMVALKSSSGSLVVVVEFDSPLIVAFTSDKLNAKEFFTTFLKPLNLSRDSDH